MRAKITFLLLWIALSGLAQDLKVPTLESKGVKGQVKTIEWYNYQFIENQGLVYVKKDVETYDDEGRLSTILSHLITNNQTYKYVYSLDKKGLLTEMKIVNPSNNLALQTTSYEYKKGLVSKTTQVQSPNSVERTYEYDNNDHLISVEVKQNGTVQLNEYYEVDAEGRRTKLSSKLPTETQPKIVSTYTYEVIDGELITTEKRNTDQGEFVIVKYTDQASKRDLLEQTTRVSNGQKGTNRQVFEDDERGNWIKGEIIDDQFGRGRLVIRKITYTDGLETGRTEMKSPEDDRGQYIRKYTQMQLAVNGKIANTSSAFDLPSSNDRLVYVTATNSWFLLKGYDDNSNMTSWAEAEIITNKYDAIIYVSLGVNGGIYAYQNGKRLFEGTATYSDYSSYQIGPSTVAYVRGNLNKTFVAEHPERQIGKVVIAELTEDDYYWGKATDSTYILTAFGRSIGVQKQLEDKSGNKLVNYKSGALYYWYMLPNFRKRFDEGEPGDIYPARYLRDPLNELKDSNLVNVDFSGFAYDKLANGNYRLKSKDGSILTAIASKTVKTPDDQLLGYFPLTKQYLRMDGFYSLESGKEFTNQKVSVMLDSSAYAYYLYNEGQSIVFYEPDKRMSKYKFSSHKLDNNKKVYGAVLYDSVANMSYGMNYDLDGPLGMGPMNKLPYNAGNVYLLKLEANRWVIFEKGNKVDSYDFSQFNKDKTQVIHFYKGGNNKVRAYQFPNFEESQPGDFIYANHLTDKEVAEMLSELSIDPSLAPVEKEVDLGNLEFTKKDDVFYFTDANGIYTQGNLGWFSSFNSKNLIAYDSVGHALYELTSYYEQEEIENGKVKVLISNSEDALIHWGNNRAMLAISGEFQGDIKRTYITQNAKDPVWKELIYDQSNGETYRFEYKNDTTFKVLPVEKLPKNADAAYLLKLGEKSFNLIAKGQLVNDANAKSYNYQGDLVRFFTPAGGSLSAYRFKGFVAAKELDVIPAEIVPQSQVNQLAQDISKAGN